MTITRYRNGSGTTVTVDETRDPIRVRLPSRAPDGPDDEIRDAICDRGSVIPSERWSSNARAEVPDAAAVPDVDDLLTDFEIEEYCTTFHKKPHYKRVARNRHPYVTINELHGWFGEPLPLLIPYEVAAREEERMFKLVYDASVRARPMTPNEFKEWKIKYLTWHEEDDDKPLRELMDIDPIPVSFTAPEPNSRQSVED